MLPWEDSMRVTLVPKLMSIGYVLATLTLITPTSYATDAPLVDPIVTPEWLYKAFTDNLPVQIVDVRKAEYFNIEHIPAAIHLPAELTFDNKANRTLIAQLDKIRNSFSNAGLKNESHIVIYDDGALKDAGHVFWVMETYGHPRVSVLDGGLPGWKALGAPVTDKVSAITKSNYIPSIDPHRLSTLLSIRLAVDNSNVTIIDSRSESEYLGLESEAKQSGHIPSSINIPSGYNLTQVNGVPRVKSIDELNELYGEADPLKQSIVYCNRGKESAKTYLIMRSMGRDVSVYDGAWLEWGNDVSLPIEQ